MTFMMNFYTFVDEWKSEELLFQVEVVLRMKMRWGHRALERKILGILIEGMYHKKTNLTEVQQKHDTILSLMKKKDCLYSLGPDYLL